MADDSMPEHADLATAMDHMVTGAMSLAGASPSGNPHAMAWFESARNSINAWREKHFPKVEDPPVEDAPSDDTPVMDQEASQDSSDFSAESSSNDDSSPDMAAKAPAE